MVVFVYVVVTVASQMLLPDQAIVLHARHTAQPGWDQRLAHLGRTACLAAAVGLLYYLARSDRGALVLIGVRASIVVAARSYAVGEPSRHPEGRRTPVDADRIGARTPRAQPYP